MNTTYPDPSLHESFRSEESVQLRAQIQKQAREIAGLQLELSVKSARIEALERMRDILRSRNKQLSDTLRGNDALAVKVLEEVAQR